MANPLRGYRKRHGLSQAELADRLDVSRSWVAQIETGVRRVTIGMAMRIEERLGINPVLFWPSVFRKRAA